MVYPAPWRSWIWLSFLDKTNFTVTVLTTLVNLYTRSAGVAYFTAGAAMCSLTVKLIKKVIRQPRPPPTRSGRRKVSYGMPSTHSATINFFTTYIVLACIYLPTHYTLPQGWISHVLPPIITIPWALMIMMSRVWLGHHTWAQVIAGASYGGVCAIGWFSLWINGWDNYGREAEHMFTQWIRL